MTNLQTVKQRFGIIGRSELLDRALDTAVRVANTDLTVLITGESGVGKEAFSKIIHALSARKHAGFMAINCGAIPEGTINSELFGHEKGAFTGATSDRKGYFETLDKGTIFLDEVGEMPLDTQTFLLRILENGEFQRMGSSTTRKTDIRVIAATNVNLQDKIKQGKFREDLYYRLNTVPIKVPPLRERREDIYMLFRRFVIDFSDKYRADPIQLEDKARVLIENYSWPGNIRELKNVAEQLSVLSDKRLITAETLVNLVPNIIQRNLPALTKQTSAEEAGGSFQEREILFKFLFDMKSDLSDLKSLVFELISRNNLSAPSDFKQLQAAPAYPAPTHSNRDVSNMDFESSYTSIEGNYYNEDIADDSTKPFVLDATTQQKYEESEVVEENLRLEDHEKELIKKALKKHNGRRKEAADDLGISERTLYRKIKQYDL